MTGLILGLGGVSCLISGVLCFFLVRWGNRWGLVDGVGTEAHKQHARAVPNTGGIGIAWAVIGPMLALLAMVWLYPAEGDTAQLLEGARSVTLGAVVLIAALLIVHIVGLIDDRRPLPPGMKLLAQFVAAAALVVFADMRVLQLLDHAIPAGYLLSVVISVLWIVAITNSFNMLDNMDGLSAGVAAIAASIFLGAALLAGQWFVAGAAALLLGATLGFLLHNFPPARLFMGDGGSLVVGMLLAVVAIRTTYIDLGDAGAVSGDGLTVTTSGGHAVLTPLVVLAVPLYDLCSVVLIRLRQGRRPWVGDTQHFSHRLVLLGLSRRRAVGVIYLATAATGLGGLVMGRVQPWHAAIIALAAMAVLAMIGLLEHGSARARSSGRA